MWRQQKATTKTLSSEHTLTSKLDNNHDEKSAQISYWTSSSSSFSHHKRRSPRQCQGCQQNDLLLTLIEFETSYHMTMRKLPVRTHQYSENTDERVPRGQTAKDYFFPETFPFRFPRSLNEPLTKDNPSCDITLAWKRDSTVFLRCDKASVFELINRQSFGKKSWQSVSSSWQSASISLWVSLPSDKASKSSSWQSVSIRVCKVPVLELTKRQSSSL